MMKAITFIQILSAECLKTKRTPIRWLVFLAPIIYTIAIIWYFSLKKINVNTQIDIFAMFFEVWTTMIIPFGVGLISGFIVYEEELAGKFNGFLGSKLSRSSIYIGKLIILILLTTSSIIIATFVLIFGLNVFMNIPVSWSIFIRAALMTEIATLPLLAFNLWLSLAYGIGASIGFGGIGIVISAIIAIVGDKVWQFIIWAWPERLSIIQMYYLPSIAINYSKNYIIHETIKGIIPVMISFVGLLIAGLLWFNKWEGRKVYE
ncbi:lantibiotic immunity ABC transporter MutG family permease subunit [Clostridium arbusti]|uniref:lantibiotic immunity ABC transporter MutG family permease subunit n=1 Tax=Clostridium arbusti TaxID=1137848 RepID=UPI0002890692|nr:lantibiotic immunity ABC transporter MutG family permease subunit [Clostridium arbusti]